MLTAYDKRMCERQSSASTKETTSCIVSGDVVATLKSYEVILTHNSPKLRLLTSINEAHTLKNRFRYSCDECRLEIFANILNTGHISCGVCSFVPLFCFLLACRDIRVDEVGL